MGSIKLGLNDSRDQSGSSNGFAPLSNRPEGDRIYNMDRPAMVVEVRATEATYGIFKLSHIAPKGLDRVQNGSAKHVIHNAIPWHGVQNAN
jgi:hypothetical protein